VDEHEKLKFISLYIFDFRKEKVFSQATNIHEYFSDEHTSPTPQDTALSHDLMLR
jgi:hypothetical protein